VPVNDRSKAWFRLNVQLNRGAKSSRLSWPTRMIFTRIAGPPSPALNTVQDGNLQSFKLNLTTIRCAAFSNHLPSLCVDEPMDKIQFPDHGLRQNEGIDI
jgi:hypothetical protein